MKIIHGLLLILSMTCSLYANDQHIQSDFYKPVTCSPSGIEHFLVNIYNKLEYTDFLANNFSHLIQFLEYGKQTNQKRTYAKSVVRLFNNKLKSGNYVNAYAFNMLLEQLPTLLNDYFIIYKAGSLDTLKNTIYDILYKSFKSNFDNFKSNPTSFLDTLSQEILDTIQEKNRTDTTEQELRKILLIFLEMNINKLIWSPEDGLKTWETVKTIAQHLTRLIEQNILDDPDDLNDLFITLIERYCFFLDITSADLPLEFFQAVKHDMTSQSLLLWGLEEQERYITPKSEILLRSLTKSEATARAYHTVNKKTA